MARTAATVTITDPDIIHADKIVWTKETTYIDLGSSNSGNVHVSVVLSDSSLLDFVTSILRAANVKHFAFNELPSTVIEFYGDDEDELYSSTGTDYYDVSDYDEPVDEYGYSMYSWADV